jgi:ubiquinone/menaquinone biosynthesis C-methylase UbiE
MFIAPEKSIRAMGIEPGMVVVDFGAGSGFYTMEAAKRVGSVGKVYAVDIQKEMLKMIKGKAERDGYENVEIVWADLEAVEGTKLAKNIVDRVIISNILFQVGSKRAVAEEAFRILKPQCKLILIEWNESSKLGPHDEHKISQDAVKVLMESTGFVFEKDFDAGSSHYGLIFIKPKQQIK